LLPLGQLGFHRITAAGHIDNVSEAYAFQLGAENAIYREYESALDEVEESAPALLARARENPLLEDANHRRTIADQLELHLDSTEIAPDGSVYLIKRRITL
jgi:hypothetical protein